MQFGRIPYFSFHRQKSHSSGQVVWAEFDCSSQLKIGKDIGVKLQTSPKDYDVLSTPSGELGALAYGMSKGFTPTLIKNILNNGTVTKVAYGNGYQIRVLYPYNGQTLGIVLDANPGTYNFGKIVTYLTNY